MLRCRELTNELFDLLLDVFMSGSLDDFDFILIIRVILFLVSALLSLASLGDDFCRRIGGTFKGFCYAVQRYLVTNIMLINDSARRQWYKLTKHAPSDVQ